MTYCPTFCLVDLPRSVNSLVRFLIYNWLLPPLGTVSTFWLDVNPAQAPMRKQPRGLFDALYFIAMHAVRTPAAASVNPIVYNDSDTHPPAYGRENAIHW